MAQVKIGVFKFGEDEFELRYVVDNDMQVLFVGKDIARVLKYNDCKQAIHKHVDEKYKCVFEKMGGQNDAHHVSTTMRASAAKLQSRKAILSSFTIRPFSSPNLV